MVTPQRSLPATTPSTQTSTQTALPGQPVSRAEEGLPALPPLLSLHSSSGTRPAASSPSTQSSSSPSPTSFPSVSTSRLGASWTSCTVPPYALRICIASPGVPSTLQPPTWRLFFRISEALGVSTGHWAPPPRPRSLDPAPARLVCWEQEHPWKEASPTPASPPYPPLWQALRLQINPPALTP